MIIKMFGLIPYGMIRQTNNAPLREGPFDDDWIPPRDGEPKDPAEQYYGDDEEDETKMSPKAALLRINKTSAEIYNLLNVDHDLEDWVVDKLNQAADIMNNIHGHITYEKKKPDSLPQGTETVMAQTRPY